MGAGVPSIEKFKLGYGGFRFPSQKRSEIELASQLITISKSYMTDVWYRFNSYVVFTV